MYLQKGSLNRMNFVSECKFTNINVLAGYLNTLKGIEILSNHLMILTNIGGKLKSSNYLSFYSKIKKISFFLEIYIILLFLIELKFQTFCKTNLKIFLFSLETITKP